MPLIESEPDALAKIYAKSLFDAAEKEGVGPEAILGEIEDILEIARNDRNFSEMLSSRLIDTDKRDASLERVFSGKVSPTTLNFLRLLNRKGRLGYISPITGALDALVQARFGRVEVDVFTAAPIGQSEMDSIKSRLNDALGKDVILHPYTDSSMLGGIKLRIGDQLIDASVRAELRRMRDGLIDKGTTVRSRSNNIID
ncbi:MAG: ATP synthase F1 subunit delta [Phycisphaerales bacterium]